MKNICKRLLSNLLLASLDQYYLMFIHKIKKNKYVVAGKKISFLKQKRQVLFTLEIIKWAEMGGVWVDRKRGKMLVMFWSKKQIKLMYEEIDDVSIGKHSGKIHCHKHKSVYNLLLLSVFIKLLFVEGRKIFFNYVL